MEMVSSFGFHGELFLGQSKNVQMACNSFYLPKFQGKWILLRDFRPLLTKKPPPALFTLDGKSESANCEFNKNVIAF